MSKLCIISLFAMSSVLLFAQSQSERPPVPMPPASPPENNNPYILKDFNKKDAVELMNGTENGEQCWGKPKSYSVCFKRRSGPASYSHPRWNRQEFFWSNDELPFYVEIFTNDEGCHQRWFFGGHRVYLFKRATGYIAQYWYLGNSMYFWKSIDGEVVKDEWNTDNGRIVDENNLKLHKSVIASWCAVNYDFVGKENCVIY